MASKGRGWARARSLQKSHSQATRREDRREGGLCGRTPAKHQEEEERRGGPCSWWWVYVALPLFSRGDCGWFRWTAGFKSRMLEGSVVTSRGPPLSTGQLCVLKHALAPSHSHGCIRPFMHRRLYLFARQKDSAPGVFARGTVGGGPDFLVGRLWLYPCVRGDLGWDSKKVEIPGISIGWDFVWLVGSSPSWFHFVVPKEMQSPCPPRLGILFPRCPCRRLPSQWSGHRGGTGLGGGAGGCRMSGPGLALSFPDGSVAFRALARPPRQIWRPLQET
jgi:hypothetical protein